MKQSQDDLLTCSSRKFHVDLCGVMANPLSTGQRRAALTIMDHSAVNCLKEIPILTNEFFIIRQG